MNLSIYDRMADVEHLLVESCYDKDTVQVFHKWIKRLNERITCGKLVKFLTTAGAWQDLPSDIYKNFDNNVDFDFCRLIKFCKTEHIRYNVASLYRMWNKLKAQGQHHILTYLRLTDIQGYGETLLGSDLLRLCYKGADSLKDYTEQIDDIQGVALQMRIHLGVSLQADLKASYKKWVMANHPDKGGDVGKFVLVNACYEELKASDYFTVQEVGGL